MLRAQSFRRPLDQPATLDGTIARVDPATGNPLPSNPNYSARDIDRRRIVAYGLRNPYRFTLDPNSTTTDLWIADVGEATYEEVDEDSHPLSKPTLNFGWPCYEGDQVGPTYGGISYYSNFELCAPTVGSSPLAFPFYEYMHVPLAFPGDTCIEGTDSALSAISFADDHSPYPPVYRGALFLGDYTRSCIWALLPDTPGGRPDPNRPSEIVMDDNSTTADAGSPVDLETGPDHNLYYADTRSGAIRKLSYGAYPDAVAIADPTFGRAPLTIHFHGDGSTSPDLGARYAWQLGDGSEQQRGADVTHRYTSPGLYTATLTVTDHNGNRDSSSIRIAVGPIFSHFAIGPKIFATAGRPVIRHLHVHRGVTLGTALRFTVLESALMKASFARLERNGRRTLFRRLPRQVVFSAPAGRDRWLFSGWIGRTRLRPGTYRVTLRPYYGSLPVAHAITATFRVLSR
jgi:hypothetical protein